MGYLASNAGFGQDAEPVAKDTNSPVFDNPRMKEGVPSRPLHDELEKVGFGENGDKLT
jgi:hypothetical protein